jgi:hypothetical protein
MAITNKWKEISVDFNIYGLKDSVWEQFIPGNTYEAFLIERK